MCGAGVDKDGVAWAGIVVPTVAVYDLDVLDIAKILRGTGRKVSVDLDADDVAAGPNDFSHDRRVVSDAATDMNDAVPFVKFKRLDTERKITRLAIVQLTNRINRDEYVAVQTCWVVIGRDPVISVDAWTQKLPRSRPKKVLAGHVRERSYQRLRLEVRCGADFRGIPFADLFKVRHSSVE